MTDTAVDLLRNHIEWLRAPDGSAAEAAARERVNAALAGLEPRDRLWLGMVFASLMQACRRDQAA